MADSQQNSLNLKTLNLDRLRIKDLSLYLFLYIKSCNLCFSVCLIVWLSELSGSTFIPNLFPWKIDLVRVNGWSNYEYPGQHWVPKLVKDGDLSISKSTSQYLSGILCVKNYLYVLKYILYRKSISLNLSKSPPKQPPEQTCILSVLYGIPPPLSYPRRNSSWKLENKQIIYGILIFAFLNKKYLK